MAVNKLQGVGVGERRLTRKEFVKSSAQRIEVGAIVNKAVYPPGLLGRNIGQGAGELARFYVVEFS